MPVFQRPRKIGAKYTGSDFAPDEYIQPQLDFDYDGKRDQWNGYDISEHKHIAEEFQKLEEVLDDPAVCLCDGSACER